jgi:hypothetical protein
MHPERALGFLPHELTETHLRMIWRRWKKKARMKLFGTPVTPFGPDWIDRTLGRLPGLKGDFVIDFRLIDYFACLMSTQTSGALDGRPGSEAKLKSDLTAMGIFHTTMPLYLLYRLRQFDVMGFAGFEGRHYSQFQSFRCDLEPAATLQVLLSALALQYIFRDGIRHGDIPDTPRIESERRQIFFSAAIGIPTFYIHRQSSNQFLGRLLEEVRATRFSHRYPGYIRVKLDEYRWALVRVLRREARDLIRHFGAEGVIDDLEDRLRIPGTSAADRLTRGILDTAGARSPLKLPSEDFNQAAEQYYRDALRSRQMEEGLDALQEDLAAIDAPQAWRRGRYNRPLYHLLRGQGAEDYVRHHRQALRFEMASEETLEKLIHLFILTTLQRRQAEEAPVEGEAP